MDRGVQRFEDLLAYRKAFEAQQQVFDLSKCFPREERYSLTDQLRRSSRSVGANLAEAWHKRRYEAHFLSKLSDADAELAETRHWLHTAHSCRYLSATEHDEIQTLINEVGRLLGGMMRNPTPWLINSG
ncbi:MAG TPA: four helix bundle protein [Rubricoccaceae bacterium]|jgi:four helix bundle protein|nr:four helix bundle protein [Rubricoccaceae bacterium]